MNIANKNPTISIITVCFNAASTLEKTILSVLTQNYSNLEYIVVDGGSKDQTLEIVKKYKNKISHVISEPDNGPFDAMNKGISLATGELVGIINADDWYEIDTFQKVAKAYSENYGVDLICGNMQYWEGSRKGKLSIANLGRLKKEMSLNHPTFFITKVGYTKFGNFDLNYRLASDYELALRFHINNAKIIVIDSMLANMSLDGMSDKNWSIALKEVLLIKKKYLNSTKSRIEYIEIFTKEFLVRSFKMLGLYQLYKLYKNALGFVQGKGKRFS